MSGIRGISGDLRQLIKEAEKDGWSAERTRGGHIRFTRPGRGPVFFGSTPGDRRAYMNCRSALRRAAAPSQRN